MRVVLWICVCQLTLLGTVLEATERHPLIRVHATLLKGSHGFTLLDEDLFIATDGAITGVLSMSCNGCPSSFFGWRGETRSGSASAPQVSALRRALVDNRVGIQSGDCLVVANVGLVDGDYEVRWYGRGMRQNTFTASVGRPAALPPCAPEVGRIIAAIETYATEAGVPHSGFYPAPP